MSDDISQALAARVRLRHALRDAEVLGIDSDPDGSVAACAARTLLRGGCRDPQVTETWEGVLLLWIAERTRGGIL